MKIAKLAEQQKNQPAEKNKSIILKQTHDKQLAETFKPITKKLEEVDKSTKKLGEVFEKRTQTATENLTPISQNFGVKRPDLY